MNRCEHCGAFVPVEKAFCPNCSEPMELEETSNRAHSFSSDMLATIRDDPEKYRQMLMPPSTKKQTNAAPPTPASPPGPGAAASPPVGYNAPEAVPIPPQAAPTRDSSYLPLIVGVLAFLILVFIILYVFKVI